MWGKEAKNNWLNDIESTLTPTSSTMTTTASLAFVSTSSERSAMRQLSEAKSFVYYYSGEKPQPPTAASSRTKRKRVA